MAIKPRLHLFEGYGVELEYMIVDRNSLDIRPISEILLTDSAGVVRGETDHGITAWSNELVAHVIELKSNGPVTDLRLLGNAFHKNIVEINNKLTALDAQLLPTAAHPWMNPARETKLWEHESQEIYHAYDRIFNCRGHGWSNLQSVHINLPFFDDEEFARLHTAIRFLLPLIPALTAASPILDGKFTGYFDKRLYYYEKNQSNIPVLTGKVIPEKVFSRHGYQKHIYDRIASAIRPHDKDNILKPVWLNSRGAMARFDRGAIEIRVIDIQECPAADMAIVVLMIYLIKHLVSEKWVKQHDQQLFETDELYLIYRDCVKNGSQAQISNEKYLEALGVKNPVDGRTLWNYLIQKIVQAYPTELDQYKELLIAINENGTLAERIINHLGRDFSNDQLKDTYRMIGECLQTNVLFPG